MKVKIKVGDLVKVKAGKDNTKTGKVIKLLKNSGRVAVEGLNIRTKHVKKTQERAGEIVRFEATMDISNVMVVCPHCKKETRVGYKKLENGKKQRVCKKCNESLDQEKNDKK